MPVFGITTTDGLGEPTGPNYKNVSKFTLSESGLVNKLSLFMFAAVGTAQVRGALYADSSGSPAAFKAVGSEFTVVDGAGLAWFDSTISPSVLLAPGDYWLGFNSTGGGLRLVYHSVAGNRKYGPETYSASPSDPFLSLIHI